MTLFNRLIRDEESQEAILEDSRVEFGQKVRDKRRKNDYLGTQLRRIVVDREDKDTPLILATNDFERCAQEIADIDKKRWAIKLFLKWIKQNLKLKKYLGRSKNSVKPQIYIALITYLLVKIYPQGRKTILTLKLCLVELKSTLFSRPDIAEKIARKRRTEFIEFNNRKISLADYI